MNFENGLPSLPEISRAQAPRLPWLRDPGRVGPGTQGAALGNAPHPEGECGGRCESASLTHRLAGGLGFPNETLTGFSSLGPFHLLLCFSTQATF